MMALLLFCDSHFVKVRGTQDRAISKKVKKIKIQGWYSGNYISILKPFKLSYQKIKVNSLIACN